MDNILQISKTQEVMAFVATCIEATARVMKTTYKDVFHRMARVGLIDNFIIPHYDTLHTESRENIANEMIECLNNWEERQ